MDVKKRVTTELEGLARDNKMRWGRVRTLHALEEMMRRLPEPAFTYINPWDKRAPFDYRPQGEEAANKLRSQVAKVMRVVARREIDYDGKPMFVMEKDGLKVTIYGAGVAPDCELVEYQELIPARMETRWRVECGKPTDAKDVKT